MTKKFGRNFIDLDHPTMMEGDDPPDPILRNDANARWSWSPAVFTDADGENHRSARLVCPFGHAGVLTDHHFIQGSGRVIPNVNCHVPGCTYHNRAIRLLGWAEKSEAH